MASTSNAPRAASLPYFLGRPFYLAQPQDGNNGQTDTAEPALSPPSSHSSSDEKEPFRLSADHAADSSRLSGLSAPGMVHNTHCLDTDIEAMIMPTPGSGRRLNDSTSYGVKYGRHAKRCPYLGVTTEVWPGQSHWKRRAKEQKIQRSCTCLSRLSKRKRMAVKILIGLLVIGVAVGVGLGISKALGAPMWSPHDHRNNS